MQFVLLIYIVCSLVSPVLWVGDFALRTELPLSVMVFIFFLIHKAVSRTSIKFTALTTFYFFFLLSVALATIINLPYGSPPESLALVAETYGLIRPLLVVFVFANSKVDSDFDNTLLKTIVFASPLNVLMSLGQTLNIPFVTELTLHYYSSTRQTSYLQLDKFGYILRSPGIFETPAFNGTFHLLLLSLVIIRMLGTSSNKERILLLVLASLSLASGVSTLSATFFLGFAVLVAITVLFFMWNPKRWILVLLLAFVVSLVTAHFVNKLLTESPKAQAQMEYQTERITKGYVFESRYDTAKGILAGTTQEIKKRLLLGWGIVRSSPDVFLGDSTLVTLMFRGGIFGTTFFILGILWILWHTGKAYFRYRRAIYLVALSWTLMMLASGFGSPSFYIPRLQECYWALIGLATNPFLAEALQEGQHDKRVTE